MTRIEVRNALTMAGVLVFIAGIIAKSNAVRIAGIGLLAVAMLLKVMYVRRRD